MSNQSASTVHQKVLNSLKDLTIDADEKNFQIRIEELGGRIDIPRHDLSSPKKPQGQRKKNLFYTDAILTDETGAPRILVEIVDSSPSDPNGITGLVINADRVVESFYDGVDLTFVVLGELKEFWCQECNSGHRVSTSLYRSHFTQTWNMVKGTAPEDILHEGTPMNYRKALKDYPLAPYLRALRPPSVLFLNKTKIDLSWSSYETHAVQLVCSHLRKRIENRETNIPDVRKHRGIVSRGVGERTAHAVVPAIRITKR